MPSARPTPSANSQEARLFCEDELVVALPYERLVRDRLRQWRAVPVMTEQDVDPRLGLARVRIDPVAAAGYLRASRQDWAVKALNRIEQDRPEALELELVMACLRGYFAMRYDGWVPTLGKNRVLSRLTGSYVIDGGGTRRGPVPVPHYVIDGGGGPGEPRSETAAGVIALRGRAPGSGVRVGVVDTRLGQHPWLSGGYIAPAEELLPLQSEEPLPWQAQHATFVTGLILRQAPGAVVELRGALDDTARADSWSVARIIADLADSDTDVVNLSLGCSTEDGRPPLVLSAALGALGPRTVVVAAAGNHGRGRDAAPPCWPAALDNVIAVGALDGGQSAAFSPHAPWVDAMAPGIDVVSTSTVDGPDGALFARWSGTSFAAAAVSGAIAAATTQAGSAGRAWNDLRREAPKDSHRRPKIVLRTLSGWPPDHPASRADP
jgi:hypothetical protein